MNDSRKKPGPADGVDLDDLPPLDGDEVETADPAELAGYLTDFEEDESILPGDLEVTVQNEDERTAAELADLEQESWVEVDNDERNDEIDIGVDDEETGWADTGNDDAPTLEEDWFVNESDVLFDDNDEDGLIEDNLGEIDSSTWDDLGDDIDNDELESIEEVMDRLGIAISDETEEQTRRSNMPRIDRTSVIERQFLGPIGGQIEVITAAGGSVVGAGDGIYLLGADGMLHRGAEDIPGHCTSICTHGRDIFVGTEGSGAFRLDEPDRQASAINGWNSVWMDDRPVEGRVATSFRITGQPMDGGFRLLGCTGEGQLFVSTDRGRTWIGPLTDRKCLGATPIEGTDEVVALVAGVGAGARAALYRSSDLAAWHEISTPATLAAVSQPGALRLAAATGTMLATVVGSVTPLFCSLDGGREWTEIPSLCEATALAVDPNEPGWIAAAVHDDNADIGVVRVSDDGGLSWKTVALAGKRHSGRRHRVTEDTPHGLITCLVVDVGRTRRLFAAAREGVQRIVLAQDGLSH